MTKAAHRTFGPAVLITSLLAMPVFGENVDELAEQLIALRSEVESLHTKLDDEKAAYKQRMSALSMQQEELEATLKREEMRAKGLRRDLANNRKLAREAGVDDDRLRPVVLRAIADMRQRVEDSLPFKRAERLRELGELENRIETEVIPPHKGVNRLWSFYEDEIRLTGESGLYRQTISVRGREVLAEVARVGTVMMFFRTHDDEVGFAEREAGGWNFRVVGEARSRDRIEHLFDALQKQIRTGYFELPQALNAKETAK